MPEALIAEPSSAAVREGGEVLVVDDDDTMRALIKLHLLRAGYEVLEAPDAVEGGALALSRSPALVVCDVEMEPLDGYRFALALKSDPRTRDIPIVFLSAHADVADRAVNAGALGHVAKPVTGERLLRVVRRFVSPSVCALGE